MDSISFHKVMIFGAALVASSSLMHGDSPPTQTFQNKGEEIWAWEKSLEEQAFRTYEVPKDTVISRLKSFSDADRERLFSIWAQHLSEAIQSIVVERNKIDPNPYENAACYSSWPHKLWLKSCPLIPWPLSQSDGTLQALTILDAHRKTAAEFLNKSEDAAAISKLVEVFKKVRCEDASHLCPISRSKHSEFHKLAVEALGKVSEENEISELSLALEEFWYEGGLARAMAEKTLKVLRKGSPKLHGIDRIEAISGISLEEALIIIRKVWEIKIPNPQSSSEQEPKVEQPILPPSWHDTMPGLQR